MSQPGLRLVVADDDEAVRDALADLVESQPDLELVGAAGDHVELVALATRMRPDVVVMDVRMPGGEGWTTVGQIKALAPEVAVLAVSAFDEPDDILAILASGASGYLVKGISDEDLLEAVHRAARGQLSMSVNMAAACMRTVLRDLDHLRRVEAGLRQREGAFHDLLDRTPTGVVLVGPGDRIRLANAEADRMFGRRLGALVGQPASALLPGWCRVLFMAMLAEAHDDEGGETAAGLSRELAGLRADGREFPAAVEMRPLTFGNDRVVGVFVRDLTGVHDMEARYQRLMESSPDALLIVDAGHGIELANAMAGELFGYERRELLAQRLDAILPGGTIETSLRGPTRVLPGAVLPAVEQSITVVGRRRDGTEFPAELRACPLDGEEGSFVLAVHDLTEQLRHERVLEESFQFLRSVDRDHQLLLTHLVRAQEEERNRISAGIHDDSLQAITAASLRVQQLRRRLSDPRDVEVLNKLEETIQLSISRLRHLIFDLRPPDSKQAGLAGALNTYLEQLRRTAPIDFRVESDLGEELPPDSQVIAYRIAQEALTNIWKHADARSVRVQLTSLDGGCLVVIEDDGKGYDPLEAEGKPGHLGLSLMQERAQIAGGWCRIESTPGSGTTVQFWIPESSESARVGDLPAEIGTGAP